MECIKKDVYIQAPAKKIYNLLDSKAGLQRWLTKQDGWSIYGEEGDGDVLSFQFGSVYYQEMLICGLIPGSEVVWECLMGHTEWVGTFFRFAIEAREEGCVLHFSHSGWSGKSLFYQVCNDVWSQHLCDIKRLAEERVITVLVN